MSEPVPERAVGQQDRSEETRRRIVTAARELVVERGYEAVSVKEVLERAGVSRGGLYHHFRGRTELMAGVLESLELEILAKLEALIAGTPDAFTALEWAAAWYLDECMTSVELQRIGLIEGRKALGWETWREVISPHGLRLLGGALAAAMNEGTMRPADPEALALLLLAALHEATAIILTAPDRQDARVRAGASLGALLEGLRRT
ncbi:MAG TPA: TetR/AcrR family transcriptional regulator [Solirubrobacteraceae bacterium]|jgi:AcrR family transcriptional regulator|nr:TetR/AcrR family transcriptional regulator [Solirubrobacteraceae bacterium]